MRVTSFTDFGLRALMRAAAAPDEVLTTEAIAAELQISRHHLTKVLRELAAAGIVKTSRGAGSGFILARPPAQISLGEVVRLLEARHALVECFRADGGPACWCRVVASRVIWGGPRRPSSQNSTGCRSPPAPSARRPRLR